MSEVACLAEYEAVFERQGIPIELQLDRGNEGVGGDLNSSVSERILRDQ